MKQDKQYRHFLKHLSEVPHAPEMAPFEQIVHPTERGHYPFIKPAIAALLVVGLTIGISYTYYNEHKVQETSLATNNEKSTSLEEYFSYLDDEQNNEYNELY